MLYLRFLYKVTGIKRLEWWLIMAVTIKEIAQMCGVSRGTVDRVLNNRGKVKPETEQKIRQIVEQLGYTPNIAGKALAVRKKNLTIGVILISEGNAFFDDVLRGIAKAEEEIENYGVNVMIRTMKGYDVELQQKIMDELKEKSNLLILNPINSPLIAEKINQLTKDGIDVITINTDIENSNRICHVGNDYVKSGRTACGMMGLLKNGKAKIGILNGSNKILGHNQRVEGFKEVAARKYPKFDIIDMVETNDDDIQGFEVCKKMLSNHPEIDALYIVAAGAYGICRAVISMGLEEKLTIISFDDTPPIREMMQKGLIKATICQQPYTQGYKAINLAFQYLVSSALPEKNQHIVKNEIKIIENL